MHTKYVYVNINIYILVRQLYMYKTVAPTWPCFRDNVIWCTSHSTRRACIPVNLGSYSFSKRKSKLEVQETQACPVRYFIFPKYNRSHDIILSRSTTNLSDLPLNNIYVLIFLYTRPVFKTCHHIELGTYVWKHITVRRNGNTYKLRNIIQNRDGKSYRDINEYAIWLYLLM